MRRPEAESPSETARQLLRGDKDKTVRFFVILGVVLLLVIVLIINVATSAWRGGSATPSIAGATSTYDAQQQLAEVQAAQWEDQEKQALAKMKLTQAGELGKKALDAVIIFENQIQRWDSEIVSLLKDDRGRLLATKKDQVQTVAAILERPRPPIEEAQSIRAAITGLLAPVTRALADETSSYAPGDAVLQGLLEQKSAAEQAASIYEERMAVILRLLPPGGGPPPANAPSLELAIEALKRQQSSERAATINAEEDKARQEKDERLAKVKAEQVRIEAEAEERLIRAQTEELRMQKSREQRQLEAKAKQLQAEMDAEDKRLEADIAAQKNKAETERLRALAADPETQKLFQPFLAKGTNQVGQMNSMWRPLPYPMPAAYTDLANGGVLSNTGSFTQCGARKGNHCGLNDRPSWPYPNTEAGWKEMERRRQLFMQLAPIWIEMGLLRP